MQNGLPVLHACPIEWREGKERGLLEYLSTYSPRRNNVVTTFFRTHWSHQQQSLQDLTTLSGSFGVYVILTPENKEERREEKGKGQESGTNVVTAGEISRDFKHGSRSLNAAITKYSSIDKQKAQTV